MRPGNKNSHISLEFAFECLTKMMQDPLNSDLCALRINLAADRINEELESCTSVAEKVQIAKSHPQFLRKGIKFLTKPQSPYDHMTMMNHLMECRCNMGPAKMQNLHKIRRRRPDGQTEVSIATLIFDAVATVCNCISLNLSELTRNRFRSSSSKNRKGEGLRWPQDPDDLLPYGPKNSLVGMEVWVACQNLGCEIFMLAGSIAQFYAPFTKEIFQLYEYTFAFRRTIMHLKEAVKFYDRTRASDITQKHLFEHPVKTIFSFYNVLSSCDTPNFNIMVAARGKWIAPTLSRLTSILRSYGNEWSQTRSLLAIMCAYATADIDPTTGLCIVKFERDQVMTGRAGIQKGEDAFHNIIGAYRYLGCLNVECLAGGTSTHAQLCKKCSLIRYCGPECQKKAWDSPVLPHKRTCKQISSVKRAFGEDKWALLGTPDFTYTLFQHICEEKSIDLETVEEISHSISALRIQKNIFQADQRKANRACPCECRIV